MAPARPASRTGFEIAILCALKLEAEAVQQLFDDDWDDGDPPYDKAPGDLNAYSTGRIGRHNVVLAHMPGMGTNAAAVVASNCKNSYPNVRLALVVGICGAVPMVNSGKTEIVLGDVIVSTGVIQYDFGRQLPEQFVRKDTLLDSLGRPNMEIRALVGKLDTLQHRKKLGSKVTAHLKELQKEPELEAEYPGASLDRLFKPNYRHLIDGQTCGTCGCDGELVMRRRLVDGVASPSPAVHFGLIASGNRVMKSGQDRDDIAKREDVIGFEMESAGMWDVISCMVIKGACDYADSHKMKDWQRYAAATAAACAKAVLEYWTPAVAVDHLAQGISTVKHLIPFRRNPDFVGRAPFLDELKKRFGHGNGTSSACHGRVALYGLGGTGKTQIALEYVSWLQETCSTVSVFWVHASSAERFRQGFVNIAQECQVPGHEDPKQEPLVLVKEWLEKRYQRDWLMIIDSADDQEVFYGRPEPTASSGSVGLGVGGEMAQYLPECTRGAFLITTRNKSVGVRLTKGKRPIEVQRMDREESELLLRTKLEDTTTPSTDLLALSSQLEHLPLALAQSASYIEETSISVARYLQLLGDSDKTLVELLSREFETVGRDSEALQAVVQTWILSFQQIERQQPLAGKLLSFMSMLDRQDIPKKFISHYCEQEQQGGPRSEMEVTEALGMLKAYSFVTEGYNGRFDMHHLVQLVTHKWLTSREIMGRFSADALITVSYLYPYGRYETRAICIGYLSHALCVLGMETMEVKKELEARASLLHRMGGYFLFEGDWANAEKSSQEAAKIRGRVLGEENISTLASVGNLAVTYRNQGRWEEAERLGVKVMETHKSKLGVDHPDTLISIGNLASIYLNQGRWEEAERLEVKVMETCKSKLGVDHPDTLRSIANLASIYLNQGRWEEAERLEVKVMETCKSKLRVDHPDTLISIGNLALTYMNQGRWEEAERLQVEVMETHKSKLGVDHPDTLTSIGNLAVTYRNQGRWEEAERLQVEVMETRKSKLGVDHPDTLISMNNLACTWKAQGKDTDALSLMQTCVQACSRVLGDSHPHTLSFSSTMRNWELD